MPKENKIDFSTNLKDTVVIDNIPDTEIDFGSEEKLDKYLLPLGKMTFYYTKIKSAIVWLYVSFLEDNNLSNSYQENIDKDFAFILDRLHEISHQVNVEVISHKLLEELYTFDEVFKSYTGYNTAVVSYKDERKISLNLQLIVGLDEVNDEMKRVLPYVYYYSKKRLKVCGLDPDAVIND